MGFHFGNRRALFGGVGGNPATNLINSLTGKVAYWPMQDKELSNVIAYNDSGVAPTLDGTNDSGVAVAQTATGGLGLAFGYDTTTYTDVYSAALNSAFPHATGAIALYLQSNDWTPAAAVRAFNVFIDVDNSLNIFSTGTNTIRAAVETQASGTSSMVASITPDTAKFYSVVLEWQPDGGGNTDWELFVDAVSKATTSTVGELTGNLAATTTCIGAFNTSGLNGWDGDIDHVVVFDRLLTSGERSSLAALA
jgi:hypothetical protein